MDDRVGLVMRERTQGEDRRAEVDQMGSVQGMMRGAQRIGRQRC